jgi:hypothetical protein
VGRPVFVSFFSGKERGEKRERDLVQLGELVRRVGALSRTLALRKNPRALQPLSGRGHVFSYDCTLHLAPQTEHNSRRRLTTDAAVFTAPPPPLL